MKRIATLLPLVIALFALVCLALGPNAAVTLAAASLTGVEEVS